MKKYAISRKEEEDKSVVTTQAVLDTVYDNLATMLEAC